MIPFQDFMTEVLASSKDNTERDVLIPDLAQNYCGGSLFMVDGEYFTMGKSAQRVLYSILGLDYKSIARFENHPSVQYSMLDALASENKDVRVSLRINGSDITDVLSRGYVMIRNRDIMAIIWSMIQNGTLPDNVCVHSYGIGNAGRTIHARFVAPGWVFSLGPNETDPAYGSFYFKNDERGGGSFKTGAALARVACFNYVVADDEISVRHRFQDLSAFSSAIHQAVNHITEYATDMAQRMLLLRGYKLDNPLLVFEKIGDVLGIPKYALASARDYWDNQTGRETLFDVIQAVTFGSQLLSERQGHQPNWDSRTRIEQAILPLTERVMLNGERGFVTTVGDLKAQLDNFNPDDEARGITEFVQTIIGDREVAVAS